MLAMNPSLMRGMPTGHLIASLEAQGWLTPAEAELARRLEDLYGREDPEKVEARLEKAHERALEQSEFRAQLITEIVELCDQEGTKKDLVQAIKTALENSYVEL